MSNTTLPHVELCPHCGKDARHWGDSFCNMRKVFIHKDSLTIEPRASMLDTVERFAFRFVTEAKRSAEYADLAGEAPQYPATLADIDATIGFLKRFRADMQALAGHAHRFNEDDYCSICGADGRA